MTSTLVPVTNIAYVPLNPSTDLENTSTPEGKAWKEALEIIHTQDGFQRSCHGRQLESPDTMMWLLNWGSMAAYIKFTESADYSGFMQRMGIVLASPPQLYHFFPNSFPPTIPLSTAPCTELTTFHNASSSPTFIHNVERYVKVLDQGMVEGYLGAVYGDVEAIRKKTADGGKGEGEKEKASRVLLCIGWESREHHVRFQKESPLFKDNIWLLREGDLSADVVHVPFKMV